MGISEKDRDKARALRKRDDEAANICVGKYPLAEFLKIQATKRHETPQLVKVIARQYIKKGKMEDAHRTELWKVLANVYPRMYWNEGYYQSLGKQESLKIFENIIKMDVKRTEYAKQSAENTQKLISVLLTYSK